MFPPPAMWRMVCTAQIGLSDNKKNTPKCSGNGSPYQVTSESKHSCLQMSCPEAGGAYTEYSQSSGSSQQGAAETIIPSGKAKLNPKSNFHHRIILSTRENKHLRSRQVSRSSGHQAHCEPAIFSSNSAQTTNNVKKSHHKKKNERRDTACESCPKTPRGRGGVHIGSIILQVIV